MKRPLLHHHRGQVGEGGGRKAGQRHEQRQRQWRRRIVVAFVSFFLGRLASMSVCLIRHPGSSNSAEFPSRFSVRTPTMYLEQEILDQETFQDMIRSNQNPPDGSSCAGRLRFLIRDEIPLKDGFASEVQYISRLLQMALSTRRILFISKSWKSAYCPPEQDHPTDGWTCLWHSLTNCTPGKNNHNNNNHPTETTKNQTMFDRARDSPHLTYAILPPRKRSPHDITSPWFDPLLYGSRPMLPAPISFPLKHSAMIADVIPHWERLYGRYWIRSQMAHYVWRPAEWLARDMQQRLHYPTDRPFVGMHVRFTDNIPDFAKSFGRNATYTRRLEHFLELANDICRLHATRRSSSSIRDIYIATDHSQVLDWSRNIFVGWTVWGQENRNVQRSTTTSRVWFAKGRSSAAAAMATDLEVLRRADYLVGSFQSNVFRLAAQLNTAWNVHRYSIRIQRHFTVDVEWFEDP